MLKRIVLYALATVALATTAVADVGDIPALGTVKVVLMRDLSSFGSFTIESVPMGECELHVASPEFWHKLCFYDGGMKVTVDGPDGEATIDFASMRYWYKDIGFPGPYHEYHYYGIWSKEVDGVPMESDVELLIHHVESNPWDLKGWLHVKQYNLSYGLQATRVSGGGPLEDE